MQKSNLNKRNRVIVAALSIAAAGSGLWFAQNQNSEDSSEQLQAPVDQPHESTQPTGTGAADSSSAASNPSATSPRNITEDGTTSATARQIEQGEAPGSGEFTRAEFFKPVDWGADLNAMPNKEPQTLNFKPACKNHPRLASGIAPSDWAENFTSSESQQRWPSSRSHVIDWNQFWQLKDTGYQISIRWNFENPPRYSVVGYSFVMNKPDGYGAPAFPERMNQTWEEAKSFVEDWEKKLLNEGGKPGTRTMSVAGKAFNPAEVSPEEIDRAEYANSRIRGAQTGKMSCNTLTTDLSSLNCTCWF